VIFRLFARVVFDGYPRLIVGGSATVKFLVSLVFVLFALSQQVIFQKKKPSVNLGIECDADVPFTARIGVVVFLVPLRDYLSLGCSK